MHLAMERPDDLLRVYDDQGKIWKFVKTGKGFSEQVAALEQIFSRFGLLRNETRVYLYLARTGKRKAGEIAEAISLHRTETYRILRDLQKKGIVFFTFKKPMEFAAVSPEKAIDVLLRAQKMKIKLLEKERTRVAELWLSIPRSKIENAKKGIFSVLEGWQQILLKADEMLERTRKEFRIFAPAEHLSRLYYGDFTDNLRKHSERLAVTFLTENTLKSKFLLDQMGLPSHMYRLVEAQDLTCFMVSDETEFLLVVQEDRGMAPNSRRMKANISALWTNFDGLLRILLALFSRMFETGKTFHEIYAKP